jgi:hypothetical protein
VAKLRGGINSGWKLYQTWKGDCPRGTMGADVVGKLGKGKEIGPIVLLEVAKDMEELFDFLVDSFRFSIGLWMKGGG